MRKLKSHEWNEIIYMISGLPMLIGGLILMFAVVYEQIFSAVLVIGN